MNYHHPNHDVNRQKRAAIPAAERKQRKLEKAPRENKMSEKGHVLETKPRTRNPIVGGVNVVVCAFAKDLVSHWCFV